MNSKNRVPGTGEGCQFEKRNLQRVNRPDRRHGDKNNDPYPIPAGSRGCFSVPQVRLHSEISQAETPGQTSPSRQDRDSVDIGVSSCPSSSITLLKS